jgi:hypothetical protein
MSDMNAPLDIFKKDVQGNPVWLACAEDLQAAQFRLTELATLTPGEYFVFDHRTQEIAYNLVLHSRDF